MIPLTKTLDPADFALLEPEMRIVDDQFTRAREQHPMRRWEYAMALRAQRIWREMDGDRYPQLVYDVGGAGSPFDLMVQGDVRVIDPDGGISLADLLASAPRLGQNVFCLSVLEHVDNLDQFLYHLSCLVAPGGLLFLTMDCCSGSQRFVTDIYHFHWMRKRIFSETDWRLLGERLCPEHPGATFQFLDAVDWAHHGNHVYDYSFASLALVKRS